MSEVGIAGVTPSRGATTGDEMVIVTGTGFIAGQTSVRFGDEPSRAVAVTNQTTLVAVTPPGAAGVVDVTVEVPGGSGSLPSSFTYERPAADDGPDLRLAMVHSGTFSVGANGTYTLEVANAGADATTGEVVVVDTLPEGLSYVSAQGSGWACIAEGAYVGCRHPGPLRPRAVLSALQITVAVGPSAVPSVTNRARARTAGERRDWDNHASDVVVVSGLPGAVRP
ncbi:MAG: IPT/TIG domain-containing protein [Vicinamibacterales bacterium]